MLEEIKKEFDKFPIKKILYDTDEGQTFIAELIAVDKRNLWQFIEQKLIEAIKQAKIEENERPKIITIIGSTRYINEMSLIGWEFEKQGHIVLNPRLLPPTYIRKSNDDGRHAAESENVKEIIDKTYLHKVAMADEIFVVNINGYIGDSTRNELNHAIKLNKKIVWLEPESTN